MKTITFALLNLWKLMGLRNIALIAHVDHGKTTLVDKILHQSKLFRENQEVQELILDSNDLERERGITIMSKNISVRYEGTKINIIDTPGHSDFGGEVERVLNMAEGVLVLVDALEGAMPQTRFVLQKALKLNLKPIIVINKVDKPNCTPENVNDQIFDLMYSLGASEEQLDFPTLYGSSKEGWMSWDWQKPTKDVSALLDAITDYINPPQENPGPLQLQISSLDYSSYIGRIAVGKIHRGSIQAGDRVAVIQRDGLIHQSQVKELYVFEGLGKEKTKERIYSGEIVAIMGLENFDISDTIADIEQPEALTPITVDEPSMSMLFTINDSPFFGREGTYVTSRHIKERLLKETEKNLALKVEDTDSPDRFLVYGRGILHLSILVETMRREGYELQLGQPKVIIKEMDGVKHEPVEILHVNVPEEFSGKVIEMVNQRKGDIANMETNEGRTNLEFRISARGLIGLTNPLLTVTEGEAIISHRFNGYEPWKGPIPEDRKGALIAMETGTAVAYSLHKLQERGRFFIQPNDEVYEGEVVGENIRDDDLALNVTKSKKLTNVRAAASDEKISIAPPDELTLEKAMEFVNDDEYVEVTPKSIRVRKILLKEHERKRQKRDSA